MNVITAVIALLDTHLKLSRDIAEIKRNTSGLSRLPADVEQIRAQLDRIEAAVRTPGIASFGFVESKPRPKKQEV